MTDPPSPDHRCPKCKSENIDRVARRGLFERKVLSLFGRRPYRCYDCQLRFWRRSRSASAPRDEDVSP